MQLDPNIKGFIVQKGYSGKEEMAIGYYCTINKLSFKKQDSIDIPDNYIPCGSIKWISKILDKNIIPNYYPKFLNCYLNRNVWKTDKWPLGERVFIKPADKHKRFNGFITNKGYRGKKKKPYWCSDIVHFDNEWRYYVAHGKVISGEWYHGDDINVPDAPNIDDIVFPEDYFGAVDFGMFNGKMTLVEAHEPFSCGWYGKDHDKYVYWLSEGWLNKEKWL